MNESSTPELPHLLIVIGASAGGLVEFVEIVRGLPDDFRAIVVVATHREPGAPNHLRSILDGASLMPVSEPVEGQSMVCATIYVGDSSDSVQVDGGAFRVVRDITRVARMHRVDDLFETAALSAKSNCVGVVLSGMLNDGTRGLKAIHDAGGYCIVQDPNDADFAGMPENALKGVAAHFVGTTDRIVDKLIELAREHGRRQAPGPSV